MLSVFAKWNQMIFPIFSVFSIIGVLFLKWSIRVYVKSRSIKNLKLDYLGLPGIFIDGSCLFLNFQNIS